MILKPWRAFIVLLLTITAAGNAEKPWSTPDLQDLDWKDSLSKQWPDLSIQQKAAIRRATASILHTCGQDEMDASDKPKSKSELLLSLRSKKVAISADGTEALIVQGMGSCMCGGVGNCPIWIISTENGASRVVLHKIGIQTFATLDSSSNGYFDMVLGQHDSAAVMDLMELHFDGQRYRVARCAEMSFVDKRLRPIKTPTITPMKCW